MSRPVLIAALTSALALAVPAAVMGQGAGLAFSTAQAERGTAAFNQTCASCHGEAMTGGAGVPGLTGPEFVFGWKGKTAGELFDYVSTKMPPGQTGALSDQQYLDVVTAILHRNGAAPAGSELTPGSPALKTPLALGG